MWKIFLYKLLFYKYHQIKRLREGEVSCFCCGYKTLFQRGGYEICPVCFWEDDSLDEHGFSGANGMSLGEGQKNYRKYGACKREMVNKVLPRRIVVKDGRK
ncbi:hypothetical protein KKF32_01020 [Patescibacteria group bacterium]|nr:hypothetical protein [Patescibacteria group bacterium]